MLFTPLDMTRVLPFWFFGLDFYNLKRMRKNSIQILWSKENIYILRRYTRELERIDDFIPIMHKVI